MTNYNDFKRKIIAKDNAGHTWIPEPAIGSIFHTFFATDNIDSHSEYDEHSKRLRIETNIDLTKIGKFEMFDSIFTHMKHEKKKVTNNHQHSDKSHQVKAYIQRLPLEDTAEKDAIYTGFFTEKSERSEEAPLKTSMRNELTGTFFHQKGTKIENNTTVINVSASAGYPFLKHLAQHIDFELEIELVKNLRNKSIHITVNGWHNDFPAYELIIGDRIAYNYNPANHGYSGPTPYNLGFATTSFIKTEFISLNDSEVKLMTKSKDKYGW